MQDIQTLAAALAEEFKQRTDHVENVIRLLDEGNTVPFIARYRKELHGTMDDQLIREISERLTYLRNLDKRREEIREDLRSDLESALDRYESQQRTEEAQPESGTLPDFEAEPTGERQATPAISLPDQETLEHTFFPLGGLSKTEVRRIAEEHHFVNAAKPDSQDICFVPDGDYARVVELHSGRAALPGDFVDPSGKVLGQHKGIIRYTIGQRRGLGLPSSEPYYVCAIDPAANTVTLGRHEDLMKRGLGAGDFNWVASKPPAVRFRCTAKIRYRHKEQPAEVSVSDDGSVRMVFDEPQRAITPGQAVVLYDGDIVLGGGTIQSVS